MLNLFMLFTTDQPIIQLSRVFTNVTVDRGSIPGKVIQKTQKIYLIPPCVTPSIRFKVGTKDKVGKSRKKVASSHTPLYSSYSKENLRLRSPTLLSFI